MGQNGHFTNRYTAIMDFSFGIITGGGNEPRIEEIISSIASLKIPTYEILVVGSCNLKGENLTVLPFDETVKRAWITKKKNLITEYAKFENIVFLHDYFKFNLDWYLEFEKFGNDFEVANCRILNNDGTRYRDLCLWHRNYTLLDWIVFPNRTLIPYELSAEVQGLYISGGFWIAKRNFMLQHPLDESLVAMEAEDVEWSHRIQKVTKIKFNEKSVVQMLKHNHVIYQSPSTLRTQMILSYSRGNWKMCDYFYKLIPKNIEKKIYSTATNLYSLAVGIPRILKRR